MPLNGTSNGTSTPTHISVDEIAANSAVNASRDIEFFQKKVFAISKQLTTLKQQLSAEAVADYDEAEITVRLEFLEKVMSKFESTQQALEQIDVDEIDSESHSTASTLYMEVKTILTRRLNNIRTTNAPQLRATSLEETFPSLILEQRRNRVPELQLPSFSGAYNDWPDFYALFSTAINENSALSKLEKFQHLRAALKGPALDTIRSLEPSNENYDKALELLKNRFDNKLLNFQAHVKEIFGLKGVEKGSANGLRELSDKLNAHLRALFTLASKDQVADGFLIHLINQKFDVDTRIKWEENLSHSKLPQWTDMELFLQKRCRMMENLEGIVTKPSAVQQVGKKSLNFSSGARHALVAETKRATCVFCGSHEHWIYKCKTFENLSPDSRYKEAKKLQLCLNCLRKGHGVQSCTSSKCRTCNSKHHSLLHLDDKSPPEAPSKSALVSSLITSSPPIVSKPFPENCVLLATAIVFAKNRFGTFVPCRTILDSCSQINFVTSRLANQLQLKQKNTNISISGIGETGFAASKSVDICVRSQTSDYSMSFSAVVAPSITNYQPQFDIDIATWKIPQNITLADPFFHKSQRIDMLIGGGSFFELLCSGQIRLSEGSPILQKTRLGWIVAGGISQLNKSVAALIASAKISEDIEEIDSLDSILTRFWEIESDFDPQQTTKQEDIICEEHFVKNHSRFENGAYAVRLPKCKSVDILGDSYASALQRFEKLEKRLHRNPELFLQYSTFIKEYAELQHMSSVKLDGSEKVNFLPHHCVFKADSTTTKLRVVFDGSAKSSTGVSLNDVLLAGPTIQPKLFNTLLRFRLFKIAVTGDICKMYRCVHVLHPDNLLQCILWRKSPTDRIEIYKLDTVTYGTKPAAFLAIRAMHQLCNDEEDSFPLGAKIVRRDFYVDDLISGGDTIQEAIEIRQQTAQLLQKGNFTLRKWCSRDARVLEGVSSEDCEKFVKFHDGSDVTKTLGLIWEPKTDNFIFKFTPTAAVRHTKRTVLSTIARFYDPLGLLGPIIAKSKIFLQNLWKQKLHWDESLPQELLTAWEKLCNELHFINNINFPRYVLMPNSSLQIHAFCDASLSGYGSCIYIRSQCGTKVHTALLCSKSRVAPVKALTVPKLELSAACILSELLHSAKHSQNFDCETYCWSDSTVVLSWLREEPTSFNVFVANRVRRIQELTKGMIWRYVSTALNPADILSRGATPHELSRSELWKIGPAFLQEDKDNWPNQPTPLAELPERRRNVLITSSNIEDLSLASKYYNSFPTMQRIFAYIYRFWNRHTKVNENSRGPLTPMDTKLGTHLLLRMIQQIYFADELKSLRAKKLISSSSKLFSLNAFVDDFGLLRVGGRLQNSTLDFDARHPIILPKQHPITNAIIEHFHRKLLHAGPQSLLASIRLQYWPIGGRKTVASIVNKCILCYRLKPITVKHIMGNLPAGRVQACKTFFTTGIDFCGPFYYKNEIRTRGPVKCYTCIFICFATKATHMELVPDLSTLSFIAALKRFVYTRGKPHTIWTDNATNFVGARNELADLRRLFLTAQHQQAVHQLCLDEGIKWCFIPPRSPHFGGLWEAAVKAAKFHFYRAVGLSILTFEELRTLVCQISAIINSRPLYPVSENPNDLEVLTPAHFLIGAPFTAIIEPDVTEVNLGRLSRWQKVSHLTQIFWKKWSANYLTLLQERSKWRSPHTNINIGAIVILKDENLPPLKWPLGRVTDVTFGADGVARVASIQTASGTVKRAVTKIAVLPIGDIESLGLPTGGECL